VEVLLTHVVTVLGSSRNLKKPSVELRGALSSVGLAAVDVYGRSPAQLARMNGHEDLAIFLEDRTHSLVLSYPELAHAGWAVSPGSSDKSSAPEWEDDYVVCYEKDDVKEAKHEDEEEEKDGEHAQ